MISKKLQILLIVQVHILIIILFLFVLQDENHWKKWNFLVNYAMRSPSAGFYAELCSKSFGWCVEPPSVTGDAMRSDSLSTAIHSSKVRYRGKSASGWPREIFGHPRKFSPVQSAHVRAGKTTWAPKNTGKFWRMRNTKSSDSMTQWCLVKMTQWSVTDVINRATVCFIR